MKQAALDAWALVRDGGTDCVLLVGESGTGRTASLREVRVRLADEAGFVLSGAWGTDRPSAPYAGLMEAIDQRSRASWSGRPRSSRRGGSGSGATSGCTRSF